MRNAETVLGIIQDRGRRPWVWTTLESRVLRKAHARFGEGRMEKCRSRQLASRLLYAIAAWAAEARTTRGGQARYSPLAILTALTLRTVFRLAYRQAEGLLGSIVGLLCLDLHVPDHTTMSRRAATLDVPRPGNAGADAGSEPLHLLVDSTGLKLCGKGEWLLEKHGTATRRSWRMLHLGVDANTGRIVVATLTSKDRDDASQARPLLDQVAGPVASFTADGAYDQNCVYDSVTRRHPDAAVVVPPRANAVPSDTAETAPTQRDDHIQHIAEHGRMAWQNASGYNKRPDRSGHEPVETGDRRRVASAHRRAPGDRGGGRCPRAQPHAQVRTPELRPHGLTPNGAGVSAPAPLIPAPRWRALQQGTPALFPGLSATRTRGRRVRRAHTAARAARSDRVTSAVPDPAALTFRLDHSMGACHTGPASLAADLTLVVEPDGGALAILGGHASPNPVAGFVKLS